MNVIVSNKQKQIIDNANIDAIKDLNGLFNVDDLITKFKNYFFNKMILDATSVVNFTNNDVLEKLAREIGSERLYILLPETPEPPQSFIDKLVELHIYNFSTNIEDIVKFLAMPNTYENIVVNPRENGDLYVDNSVKEENNNDLYVDNSVKENSNENVEYNYSGYSDNFNDNIQLVDDGGNFNNNDYVEMNDEPVTNEFIHYEMSDMPSDLSVDVKQRVIGFKNVTASAGSTTMCYMLYLLLKKSNEKVQAIEINKNDYKYYQDKNMLSLSESDVERVLQTIQADIIIVDLNDCKNTSFCTDVFYLVEPSVIKLNKLMINNRFAFRELYGKKIILNKSLLSYSDVEQLSKEAGVAFFYNVPPVNDRVDNKVLRDLLCKIGIN